MEPMPPTGSRMMVAPGVIRLVAPNPSPMTASGTATYVLGRGRRAIIDPGPDDARHRNAILAACDDAPVDAILVTHAHVDHTAGVGALARATGAPVLAYGPFDAGRSRAMQALPDLRGGEGVDREFRPDRRVGDDEVLSGTGWSVRAIHTPGHMANHLSFHLPADDIVLTGDVVMGWASTLISPPDGDVSQFLDSLDRIEALGARRLLPGHGPVVNDPAARCAALRSHRLAREAAILAALSRHATIPAIAAEAYADTPPALMPMAERNILAHLIRLTEIGAASADRIAPDGIFRPNARV